MTWFKKIHYDIPVKETLLIDEGFVTILSWFRDNNITYKRIRDDFYVIDEEDWLMCNIKWKK